MGIVASTGGRGEVAARDDSLSVVWRRQHTLTLGRGGRFGATSPTAASLARLTSA